MFELHLGDKLSVPSTVFMDPVLLTGRAGQGKAVTFLQIASEIIKNRQSGVILDPYGDLAEDLKDLVSKNGYINNLIFCDLEIKKAGLKKHLSENKIVIAAARCLIDGERQTREKGIRFLKNYFSLAKPGQWFLIDEAFSFLDDEIFEKYLEVKKMGLNVLFCDQEISKLSALEREKIGGLFKTFIVYKTNNFAAICLSRLNPQFNPKNIAAIQQYHFQFLQTASTGNQKITYHKGVWPVTLEE